MSLKQHCTVLFSILFCGCALAADEAGTSAETVGQIESAWCRNALSPREEKTVLNLIDNICGDTWCEGDNNFAFERLTCRAGAADAPDGGTCTLNLRLIPQDGRARGPIREPARRVAFSASTPSSKRRRVAINRSTGTYLALTDCVTRLEAGLAQ